MSCYITDYHTADGAALEDSIMHKGYPLTAGSKMLEKFIAPFNAAVVDRLAENNVRVTGKTRMDEFGIPSVSSYQDKPGAVDAVAQGRALYALCNDVFGTYRRAAAERGLCYIHPTYGTVSRFGLVPLVSSMDQIGVLCKNPADGFRLLSFIAGSDPRDGAMFPEKNYRYAKTDKKPVVAFPDNFDNPYSAEFAARCDKKTIHLEYFDILSQLMYILSCAEISNNINRYDGVKFGYRASGSKNLDDLYLRTRTEAFGIHTKLAAVMGAFVLSQNQYVPYFEKAMKIRRLVKESLTFDTYDVIALPLSLGDDPYKNISLYALATLAGLPSVSFSVNGKGVQLVANVKNENALFTAWEAGQS